MSKKNKNNTKCYSESIRVDTLNKQNRRQIKMDVYIPPHIRARQKEIEDSFRPKEAPKKKRKEYFLKSDKLKAILAKKGLNISELAKMTNFSVNALYNRFQGKPCKLEELNRITKVLKIERLTISN